MARRKKGLPISGWLVIDKPAGVTSSSVVNQLRRAYDAQKAGHGGTLDPDATGVLPIAFGEATKLIPYLEDELKVYEFALKWGAETSTDDAAGEVVQRSDIPAPKREEILAVLPEFLGQIEQVPPQISAVKLDGERAYDLARSGAELQLAARPLWVEELTLLENDEEGARFRFVCGKGGYVRSIARDLGRKLGALAYVENLRRLASLGFDAEEALALPFVLQEMPDLLPIYETPDLPHLDVDEKAATRLRVGAGFDCPAEEGVYLALFEGEPLAMVNCQDGVCLVARGLNMAHD